MSNSHAYVRESAMLDWKTKMATLNEEAIKLLKDYQGGPSEKKNFDNDFIRTAFNKRNSVQRG